MYGEHGGTGEDQFRSPFAAPMESYARTPLPPREVVFPGVVELPQPDADPEPDEPDPEHIAREKKLKRLTGLMTPERRRRAQELIDQRVAAGRPARLTPGCTCDPGPEGQHQWYCGTAEIISDEDVPPGVILLRMDSPPPAEPYQAQMIPAYLDAEKMARLREALGMPPREPVAPESQPGCSSEMNATGLPRERRTRTSMATTGRPSAAGLAPAEPQRCPSCTYLLTSPSHAVVCG